jgi:hypothetical protein
MVLLVLQDLQAPPVLQEQPVTQAQQVILVGLALPALKALQEQPQIQGQQVPKEIPDVEDPQVKKGRQEKLGHKDFEEFLVRQ